MEVRDRVEAVKDCERGYFKKGDKGIIVSMFASFCAVDFGKGSNAAAFKSELRKIGEEMEVRDRVWCTVEQFGHYNKKGIIVEKCKKHLDSYRVDWDDGISPGHWWDESELRKVKGNFEIGDVVGFGKDKLGGSMYEELKERIEYLDSDSTLKQVDDMLQAIGYEASIVMAVIPALNGGRVSIYKNMEVGCGVSLIGETVKRKVLAEFKYTGQCSKAIALKEAMMWLLDHSDIKPNKKQVEINKLKKNLRSIEERIEVLEGEY